MRRFDPDEILDLVGLIYDVALSADRWESMLERMATFFGGLAAVFFVRDSLGVEPIFFRHWGLPETAPSEAMTILALVDVALETTLPPGSVTTDEMSPRPAQPQRELLAESLRRWDLERYVGGDVFWDARRLGVVAVLASQRRAPFGEAEIELMKRFIMHLRRAVELRASSDQTDANRLVAQGVVEGMLTGVVLLDARGHVLSANASARRILESGDGLALARERLRAAAKVDDAGLQKAVAEAIEISEHSDASGGAALNVSRPSGARPYAVLVSPGASGASHPAFRIASAVVLIGDSDSGPVVSQEMAMQLYGLTPSEAHLACSVASGESLESYANARGIAVSTARWTMKQALKKTGARRQSDLVRILLTGPAGVARRSDDEG